MKVFLFLFLFIAFNCSSVQTQVRITDEYIETKGDPDLKNLYELKVLKIDSIYHYPTDEMVTSIYTLVNRKNHKTITNKTLLKIYFSKYNNKYCWEVMKDPTMADFSYQDTISLKKDIWYKIRDEKERNELYFFWTGEKGDCMIIKKPLPGPGPW